MLTRIYKRIYSALALTYGVLRLIVKPNDIDPIFRMRSFEETKPIQNCLNTLRSDPSMKDLLDSRFLAEPYDFEALKKLPTNTLGYHFGMFCAGPEIDNPYSWPKIEDTADTDLIYLRRRARQTHDIHHVVLGYPAAPIGEVAISAFYVRQIQSPMNAIVVVVGILIALLKKPEAMTAVFDAIEKGWKAAANAKNFMSIRWENYFETDLDEVRRQVGITEIQALIHVELPSKQKSKKPQLEITVLPVEFTAEEKAKETKMKIQSILRSVTALPPRPSASMRAMIAKNAEDDLKAALVRSRGLRMDRAVLADTDHHPMRAVGGSAVGAEIAVQPPEFHHHAEVAYGFKSSSFEF